jgi:hypothetical protein
MTLSTLFIVDLIDMLLDSSSILNQGYSQRTPSFATEAPHQNLDEVISGKV